ncbi:MULTISPECIES: PAS domain-containing protein [Roseinatronobacter]|uniref:PAS domain-containing protein n=1 Tax=Roseinatronobacter domitianus TaxID=2940293 RepID=A0ABT0M1E8_9RHOB|nr:MULTISPECIES: PAS domain-containing protein [Roseibaca]MCL1628676.1 PAS domain-containing protein [Roseibaca domitiana]
MSDTTFTPRPDVEDAFPLVAKVCAHWAGLRTRHALPARGALDPAALAEALPHVFLGELVSPRVARIRLCGHGVEDVMGMDLRGMPLTALFGSDARDDIMAALEQVGRGVRAMLALQAEPGFGQPEMTAQLALMPLTGADGRITHVLGVLERRGQIGRRPRRFATARTAPVIEDSAPMLRVIIGGKR